MDYQEILSKLKGIDETINYLDDLCKDWKITKTQFQLAVLKLKSERKKLIQELTDSASLPDRQHYISENLLFLEENKVFSKSLVQQFMDAAPGNVQKTSGAEPKELEEIPQEVNRESVSQSDEVIEKTVVEKPEKPVEKTRDIQAGFECPVCRQGVSESERACPSCGNVFESQTAVGAKKKFESEAAKKASRYPFINLTMEKKKDIKKSTAPSVQKASHQPDVQSVELLDSLDELGSGFQEIGPHTMLGGASMEVSYDPEEKAGISLPGREFLEGFLYEFNINWMHYLGAFLVVISSLFLVISSWSNFGDLFKTVVFILYSLFFTVLGYVFITRVNLRKTGVTFQMIGYLIAIINFSLLNLYKLPIPVLFLAYLILLGEAYFITLCFNRKYAVNHIMSAFFVFFIQSFWVVLGDLAMPLLMAGVFLLTGTVFYYGKNIVLKYDTEDLKNFSIYNLFFSSFSIVCIAITGYADFKGYQFSAILCFFSAPFIVSGIYLSDLGKRLYEGKTIQFMYLSKTGITGYILLILGFLACIKDVHAAYGSFHLASLLALATVFLLFYVSLRLFKELSFFYFAYFSSIELVFYLLINDFLIKFELFETYPVIAGYLMIPIFLFWHRYASSAKELANQKIYNHSKMLLAVFACLTFMTGFFKPEYNWPLFAILGLIFCKYGLANASERFTYFGLISTGFSVIYLFQFVTGVKDFQLIGISLVSFCYILLSSRTPSENWKLDLKGVILNCSILFGAYFIVRFIRFSDTAGTSIKNLAAVPLTHQLVYLVTAFVNGLALFRAGMLKKEIALKVTGLIQLPCLLLFPAFISGFASKMINLNIVVSILVYQYLLVLSNGYFEDDALPPEERLTESIIWSVLINCIFHVAVAMYLDYAIWLIPALIPALLLLYRNSREKIVIYAASLCLCLWTASIISFTTEWDYTSIFLKGVITPFLPLLALFWFGLSRMVEERGAFVKIANSILSMAIAFIILGVVNISVSGTFDPRLYKYLLTGSVLQYFFLFYILVYTPKKDLLLEVEYSGKLYAFSGLFLIGDILFNMMYESSSAVGSIPNSFKVAGAAYLVFFLGLVFKYVFKQCHNDDIREYFIQAFFMYAVIFSVMAVFISGFNSAALTFLVSPIPVLITYFSMYQKKAVEYVFLFIFDALMSLWIFQLFAPGGCVLKIDASGVYAGFAVNFIFFILLHISFPGAGDLAGESPHRRFSILSGTMFCLFAVMAYVNIVSLAKGIQQFYDLKEFSGFCGKFMFFNIIALVAAVLCHYFSSIESSEVFTGVSVFLLSASIPVFFTGITPAGILAHAIVFAIISIGFVYAERSAYGENMKPVNLAPGIWLICAVSVIVSDSNLLLAVSTILSSVSLILYAFRNEETIHSYLGFPMMLLSFILTISLFKGSSSGSVNDFFSPGTQFCISLFFIGLTYFLYRFFGTGLQFSYNDLIRFSSDSTNPLMKYVVQPGLLFSTFGNFIVVVILLVSSATLPFTVSMSAKVLLILASLLSFGNYLLLARIYNTEGLVWLAEAVLVLSLLSFRKLLFTGGILGQYKTFIILLVSFLMYGLSILLQKSKQRIYVNPFSKTSMYMPVAVLFLVLNDPTSRNIAAVFVASFFYSLISHFNKSKRIFSISVLFFNLGIWGILYRNGITDFSYYLIPFGLVSMIVLELNKNVIKTKDIKAYRSFAALLLYLSGSFQMYQSMSLKGSLLVFGFSLAGIILGVLLKVKLYLFIGSGFLVLTVVSNLIFFSLKHTMIWWILGTLTGLGLIAVTSFLEKKRQEYDSIQNWLDSEFRGWE